MTVVTKGASTPVVHTFDTFGDGYRDDIGTDATPIANANNDLECYQVLVQNDPANTVNMYVGNQHSQSMVLTPGQTETIPYKGMVSDIYVRFTAGAANRANWHAMR